MTTSRGFGERLKQGLNVDSAELEGQGMHVVRVNESERTGVRSFNTTKVVPVLGRMGYEREIGGSFACNASERVVRPLLEMNFQWTDQPLMIYFPPTC